MAFLGIVALVVAGTSPVYAAPKNGASVNGLSCASSTLTGAASDSCTVTLSNTVSSYNGQSVSLSSNSTALQVPASVMVPQGANSASFTATALAVSATQTATIQAHGWRTNASYNVQLNPAAAGLQLSTTSLGFGSVNLNTATTQAVTLTSTGNSALTINAIGVSGTGFSASGVTTPLSLNPGQSAVLNVTFDPTAAGADTGAVTVSSNAPGGTATISLSGTGVSAASLGGVSCSSGSLTGAVNDGCTVSLTAAAPSGGFAVALASSNSSLKVPASVTVPAGTTSAAFTATASAVSTTQTATITASAGGVSKATSLQLNATSAAWSLASTSVGFGNVTVNTTSTQSVTISSTGTAALTISSGSVTGTGFSISGLAFPTTLNPGQTATLNISFAPTTVASDTGTVTLVSNASSGATKTIALSGTGQAAAYAVDLSWSAPGSSPDPVAGYNIYRSSDSGSTYQLLNSAANPGTTYTDSTVQSGSSYQYYVESVDAQGKTSTPSNTWSATIP